MRFFRSLCLIILLAVGGFSHAWALVEVPCNGKDDDGVGGDAAGPATDADCDGVLTAADADDTNKRIFAGVEVVGACSSGQFKIAASNGTYGACGFACPSGTCYHVGAGGSDVAAGTSYATRFLTLNQLSYYSSGAPSGNVHSALACGDHIYIWPGTLNTGHIETGYGSVGLLIKSKTCTVNNPITVHFIGAAILSALGTSVSQAGSALFLDADTYVTVKGNALGEITGIYASIVSGSPREDGAVTLLNSSNIDISGLNIHDNHGDGNNNPAGLYSSISSNVRFHHNIVYDQINDSGNGGNSCLAVWFRGTGLIDEYNSYGYSGTVYCPDKVKHSAFNTDIIHRYNRHSQSNFQSSAYSNTVYNNYFGDVRTSGGSTCNIDSTNGPAAVEFCDEGGPAYDGPKIVSNNTVNNGVLYSWRPQREYDASGTGCSGCGTIGNLTLNKNIAVDTSAGYSSGHAFGNVGNYDVDALYTASIASGKLVENNSCYYNGTSSLTWSFFGANPPSLGDYLNFAQLQSAGYCASCTVVNPALGTTGAPTAGACLTYGATVDYTTPTPAPTAAPGTKRTGLNSYSSTKGQI